MSHKNAFLPYLAFLVSMLPLFFPTHSQAGPPGQGKGPPPVVTVMPVTEKDVNLPDEYVGRVEAIQAVDLRARVEGYLEKVEFKEGTDVHAGDLLYLLEQAPYKAKVNEASAKVAEAEAALKNARQYLQRLKAVRSGGVSATDLETAANAGTSYKCGAPGGKGQSGAGRNKFGVHHHQGPHQRAYRTHGVYKGQSGRSRLGGPCPNRSAPSHTGGLFHE